MSVHILKAVFLLVAYSSCLAMPTRAQEKTEPSPPQAASATAPSAYPNSADGLRQLLQDCLAAAKSGDKDKLAALVKDMEIPNYEAWFAATFGSDEGAKLAAAYRASLDQDEKVLQKFFMQFVKGNNILAVDRAEQAPTPDEGPLSPEMRRALRDAVKKPGDFFFARAATPTTSEGRWVFSLGCFTFVDGKFRWLSPFVLSTLSTYKPVGGELGKVNPGGLLVLPMPALPTGTPQRIRVGGRVAAAQLIKRVEPVYPGDVRIGGTVTLHAIINKDGSIAQLQVVSGDPMFYAAALAAVKQWRYKPLLLNGQPVEVDTTIEVNFTRPK